MVSSESQMDPKQPRPKNDPRKRDEMDRRIQTDPILALRGLGKHLWADEHADEYVERLRRDWSDEREPDSQMD